MKLSHRTSRRASIGTESLESRRLLNAHVPHSSALHAAAHVSSHVSAASVSSGKFPHKISGKLVGIVSTTLNSNQGIDTYNATANTKNGVAKFSGTDNFTSYSVNSKTLHDTYYHGSAVLTQGQRQLTC